MDGGHWPSPDATSRAQPTSAGGAPATAAVRTAVRCRVRAQVRVCWQLLQHISPIELSPDRYLVPALLPEASASLHQSADAAHRENVLKVRH